MRGNWYRLGCQRPKTVDVSGKSSFLVPPRLRSDLASDVGMVQTERGILAVKKLCDSRGILTPPSIRIRQRGVWTPGVTEGNPTSSHESCAQFYPPGRRNMRVDPHIMTHPPRCFPSEWEGRFPRKARDWSPREEKLRSLSQGYALRCEKICNRSQPQRMSRGDAMVLMARLGRMLQHSGRTIEGVLEALGADPR